RRARLSAAGRPAGLRRGTTGGRTRVWAASTRDQRVRVARDQRTDGRLQPARPPGLPHAPLDDTGLHLLGGLRPRPRRAAGFRATAATGGFDSLTISCYNHAPWPLRALQHGLQTDGQGEQMQCGEDTTQHERLTGDRATRWLLRRLQRMLALLVELILQPQALLVRFDRLDCLDDGVDPRLCLEIAQLARCDRAVARVVIRKTRV